MTSRRKSPNDEVQQQQSQPTVDDEYNQTDSPTLSQGFNGDNDDGRSSKGSTPPVTTNDLLNQVENRAASPECLIQSVDIKKKTEQPSNSYTLPLTIRANPPAATQKPPSSEPSTSSNSQEAKDSITSSHTEVPQNDSLESSSSQPKSISTAVRSPTLKPSILSRSPMKNPGGQEQQVYSVTSVATPFFQQQQFGETIEQTQASSSTESFRQTTLTAGEEKYAQLRQS